MGDFWDERWVGETPHYVPARLEDTPRDEGPCGGCGSTDLECVHATSIGCNTGYSIEVEFRCQTCGRYTAVEHNYDS